MKWEYRTQELEPRECGGYSKYVADQISQEVLYRAGDNGWELVCIYNSIAYFKHPKEDYGEQDEQEEAVKEAHSEENAHQPQRCSTAGELYSRAYRPDTRE